VDILPDEGEVHLNLAQLLETNGRALEAKREYITAATQLRKRSAYLINDAESLCFLGEALLSSGNVTAAAGAFKQALGLKPHYLRAKHGLSEPADRDKGDGGNHLPGGSC